MRLVQIDTPEVYGGIECYGRAASAVAKRLLPVGARVRLVLEPASESVDRNGRLLRYVVRASDGMNVNLRLVTVGAAAPWFYEGERADGTSRSFRRSRNGRGPSASLRAFRSCGHERRPCRTAVAPPRPAENADDDWRVESDGAGGLLVFCPECWQREFGSSG